jgi:hypothetical protein
VYWNPSIAVKYRGEVYPSGGNQRQRFRDFGISRGPVIDRCTIVPEPRENNGGAGVYPDSSRSHLLWTGGSYLPWSRWARDFAAKVPDAIQEALAKATAELGRVDDNEDLTDSQKRRLKALTNRLRSSWLRRARPSDKAQRVKIVRVSVAGSGPREGVRDGGDGERGGGGGGGKRRSRLSREGDDPRYVEDPNGELLAVVEAKKPDQIPECQWISVRDFEDQHQAARWNASAFVVEANDGCPIYLESIDHWCKQFPSVDPNDIAKAVKKVYGLKLRGVVAHMLTAKRRGTISSDDLDQALSPLSLTTAVAGFILEDLALAGDIGALAGKQKAKGRG